jgi:hypothetical protein
VLFAELIPSRANALGLPDNVNHVLPHNVLLKPLSEKTVKMNNIEKENEGGRLDVDKKIKKDNNKYYTTTLW